MASGAIRALAACAVIALGGCEAVMMGVAAPGIIAQKRVNLLNASYAAAETLAHNAGKRLSDTRPLIVSDLREIPDARQSTVIENPTVGQVLGAQMRERFTQLGYNVQDMIPAAGGNFNEVSGTYEIRDGTMNVALYLHDRSNGRLLASHRYALPVTYDIKRYMTRSAHTLPAMPPLIER